MKIEGRGTGPWGGQKGRKRHKIGMSPERVLKAATGALSHLWPLHELMKSGILKLLVPASLGNPFISGFHVAYESRRGKKGWMWKTIQETFPIHLARENSSKPQICWNLTFSSACLIFPLRPQNTKTFQWKRQDYTHISKEICKLLGKKGERNLCDKEDTKGRRNHMWQTTYQLCDIRLLTQLSQ